MHQLNFNVGENRLVFDRTPNLPWFRCMNRRLERPVRLAPMQKYRLQVICDDTIATIYIDGVALNTRMYARPGQARRLLHSWSMGP